MARIALTGATGFVGRAVIAAARAEGHAIAALTRRPQAMADGVEWIAGDLADTAALGRLCAGVDMVIHVAGVVNSPDPAEFIRGNVEGTRAMIAAAQAAGVARFVCVSSLSAREPALSRYGASKHAAEELVRASTLDWTIVRPPSVYGPGDVDNFELFRAAARLGVVPVPARGRVSLIHVEDLARLLVALIPGGEAVSHRCFEPDDGRAGGWRHAEMAGAMGAACGRSRVWAPGLPKWLLALVARGDMALRGAKARLTLDRVGYMTHPDWVASPAAHVPPDVWCPAIETLAGMHATVAWYRAEGWL